jgi:hypothetical protein
MDSGLTLVEFLAKTKGRANFIVDEVVARASTDARPKYRANPVALDHRYGPSRSFRSLCRWPEGVALKGLVLGPESYWNFI